MTMKSLFTIALFIIVSNSASAQVECRRSKPILQIAVKIWQSSYSKLREESLIDQDTTFDIIQFTREQLQALKDQSPESEMLVFRYYKNDGQNLPRISIRNSKNPNTYLLDDATFVDSAHLHDGFQNWRSFLLNDSSPFLYVQEYHICTSIIDSILSRSESSTLAVQNVAKVISPANDRYEHRDSSYVGYISFDLLFTTSEDIILPQNKDFARSTTSNYYNFASPCPKLCHCLNVQGICGE